MASSAFQAQESPPGEGEHGSPEAVGPGPITMDSFLFGCELSMQARSFKVEDKDNREHVLALTMPCLTEDANIVEVVAQNHDNERMAVPLANLKLSCQPMLSLGDFAPQPPATFYLKSGSGPVQVTRRHQIVSVEGSEFLEGDESEYRDPKLLSVLPAKKQQGKL